MKDKKKDIKVFTIIGICILILLGIAYYQFDTKDKAYYVKYDIGDVKDVVKNHTIRKIFIPFQKKSINRSIIM